MIEILLKIHMIEILLKIHMIEILLKIHMIEILLKIHMIEILLKIHMIEILLKIHMIEILLKIPMIEILLKIPHDWNPAKDAPWLQFLIYINYTNIDFATVKSFKLYSTQGLCKRILFFPANIVSIPHRIPDIFQSWQLFHNLAAYVKKIFIFV